MFLPQGCMGVQPRQVRGPCAAGVDIRPGSWDVVVCDLVRGETSRLQVVRPVFVGKVSDEEQVLFVLRQYKVRYACADTRPETTLAKRLQAAAWGHGIKLWRAEYNTAPSTIQVSENDAEGLLKLDRTLTLDDVHFAFNVGLTVVLPQNFRQITGGDFVREMTSSSRVPIKWQGRDAYSWEHQGPDHAFHAFNYCLVAVQRSNLLSWGGEVTAGAHRGLVDSALDKNLVRPVSTGAKGPSVLHRGEIPWERVFAADDKGGEFFLEA